MGFLAFGVLMDAAGVDPGLGVAESGRKPFAILIISLSLCLLAIQVVALPARAGRLPGGPGRA